MRVPILGALFAAVATVCSFAQLSDSARSAAMMASFYDVTPNIVYGIANGHELKLDVYAPRKNMSPVPVVMVIHGGGWVEGSKETRIFEGLPYMEMGFAVVNVEYRLGRDSLAPAAVEDCLCVLHWVGRHAEKYHFDLSKLVVTGGSAGGHLALTTGMIPDSTGFANQCASDDDDKPGGWSGPWQSPRPQVAAIINWFGITDVAEMLQGPNIRSYAVSWFGNQPNALELARKVSPLTYVRARLPPIITIHGDADPLVPYSDATRLHDALTKAGVKNQLVTIPGGKHGDFTAEQYVTSFTAIRAFLTGLGINPTSALLP